MNRRVLYIATGFLTTVVLGVVLVAWTTGLRGGIGRYDLFPLLGLVAWSLMWMHYVSGSLKRYLGLASDTKVLSLYFQVTGIVVLALILLHPVILDINLFRDGLGLPPQSLFAAYTTTGTQIAIVLGVISLTAFLLFELGRWFRHKSWWVYIEWASVVAMGLIFVHALLIGGELFAGWFRVIWSMLGAVFVMSVIYNQWYDKREGKGE